MSMCELNMYAKLDRLGLRRGLDSGLLEPVANAGFISPASFPMDPDQDSSQRE